MSVSGDMENGIGLDELQGPLPNSGPEAELSKSRSGIQNGFREDPEQEEPETFGLGELDAVAPGKDTDSCYQRWAGSG